MPDPSLQREADDASVDFIVAHGEASLTRDGAFVAGYLAAAASRDQRIRELLRYAAHGPDCAWLGTIGCTCGLDKLRG